MFLILDLSTRNIQRSVVAFIAPLVTRSTSTNSQFTQKCAPYTFCPAIFRVQNRCFSLKFSRTSGFWMLSGNSHFKECISHWTFCDRLWYFAVIGIFLWFVLSFSDCIWAQECSARVRTRSPVFFLSYQFFIRRSSNRNVIRTLTTQDIDHIQFGSKHFIRLWFIQFGNDLPQIFVQPSPFASNVIQ